MPAYSVRFHVSEIKYWKHNYNYGTEHNVQSDETFKAVITKLTEFIGDVITKLK